MDSPTPLSPLSSVPDEHSNDAVRPSGSTTQPAEMQTSQPRAGRPRRRKHKRRNRRQSFVNADDTSDHDADSERERMLDARTAATRESFNRVEETGGGNTLLDMMDHRPRELSLGTGSGSNIQQQTAPLATTQVQRNAPSSHASKVRKRVRPDKPQPPSSTSSGSRASSPLLRSPNFPGGYPGYGGTVGTVSSPSITRFRGGPSSRTSPAPLGRRTSALDSSEPPDYDVNNPPSVPPSPVLGPQDADEYFPMDLSGHGLAQSPSRSRDAFIDIDSPVPAWNQLKRRMTRAPEEDVCFPHDILSDIGEEPTPVTTEEAASQQEFMRKKKRKVWPKLEALDQWSEKEKDDINRDSLRYRSTVEPTMVDGRYRPRRQVWHRPLEDAPFRFTYFNAEFEKTIHSQTLSGLVQPEWVTFQNLFLPDPPELESDSSEDEDHRGPSAQGDSSPAPSSQIRNGAALSPRISGKEKMSESNTGRTTPLPAAPREKRYGPRPTFWLDVLSPTMAEMRVLQRAFDLHPLTVEDIVEQEEREKVELFGHYYFCNYRSFEQDTTSDEYMEPVNMYWVVFRDGLISFHWSPTPHPANVRRRIRQLADYMVVSADWISYAIIDDITDAYQPLVEAIEDQVDQIDDTILNEIAFSTMKKEKRATPPPPPPPRHPLIKRIVSFFRRDRVTKDGYGPLEDARQPDEKSDATTIAPAELSSEMLRRVGECRKRVMSLYRLLGNKADVIKGFAKRCNEQWAVAPRNEIGMYLGDIQDHIVTMTGNLSHYENLLSRAHSNYLAQINIRMTDRAESTNNVLNKLTVLGTIVLPMNVVTGMWGMNVLVPGQDIDNLHWFWSITAFLLVFGIFSFFIARTTFGVV